MMAGTNELATAFAELRNAAQGRGLVPVVSPALAREVTEEQESFRKWAAGELDIRRDPVARYTGGKWVTIYRALYARVAGELKKKGVAVPAEMSASAMETVASLPALAADVRDAIGVAVAGAAALAAVAVVGLVVSCWGRK